MSFSQRKKSSKRWFASACIMLAVVCVAAACLAGGVIPGEHSAQSERDANWSFASTSDIGADAFESEGGPAVSSSILTDDSGARYASNRLLLTIDGSVNEQELRDALSDDGVSVARVSLVSKSLDDNDVLVVVEYEGDEDPVDLGERLAGNSVVASAEVDHVLSVDEVAEGATPDSGVANDETSAVAEASDASAS